MIKKILMYSIPIIAGSFYATGFPMFGNYTFLLGPVFAFCFLNWSLEKTNSLKKQILIGILFSFGFYQTGYYWIPHLLLEFGGLAAPFNYLLGLLFSLILLPQVYFYIFFKRNFKNIFALAFLYSLLEFFIPQQFPSHLGHTFISLTPYLPLNFASIFGSPFYSFIVCVFGLTLLAHFKTKRTPWPYYGFIGAALILSSIPMDFHTPKKTHQLNLRIVQPNIGNFLKVDSERGGSNSMKNVFMSYFDLSTAQSSTPIDLVIWPETAYPTLLSSKILKQVGSSQTPQLFKDIINQNSAELFVGGYDLNTKSQGSFGFETDFNTAFYFSNKSELKDVYHKIKLIPFGEGLPFGPLNQFLSKYVTNVSFFAKGDNFTQFTLPSGRKFSSAICYEILFPGFIRDLLNNDPKIESDFIINLTNDSWYGDTFEPYQHLFLTKWRALEYKIPIIRSTNTGITTVIYPDGRESERLMINEKKILDHKFIYEERSKTTYQLFGIYFFIVFGIIITFLERTLLLKGRVNE
jgi:apolipoprotein N-acyltransferase